MLSGGFVWSSGWVVGMDEIRFHSGHTFKSCADNAASGEISVVIPYWMYGRICEMLKAGQSSANHPLYTPVVAEPTFLDLFGLGPSSHVRG
jgi:hypothetical protein